MKKLLFSLLAIVLMTNVSFSQSSAGTIIRDIKFQAYMRDVSDFQKLPKDIIKLKSYFTDNKISELEYKDLYLALGFKTKSDYETSMNSQSANVKYLDSQYNLSKFQPRQLAVLFDEGFSFINIPITSDPTQTTFGDCETKLRNDLLINFGVATAAHVGCLTADVTVVLGILCHAAVATAHALSDDNARIEYRGCIKK
jgi:hypothetical protein